jgi:hypothetical protein
MAELYPLTDGWYQYDLVVDHTLVAANCTHFPVRVDLSVLGSNFWDQVANGGADIRITNSAGDTEMPRTVISCDTATETGYVIFDADALSGSANTTFKLKFGKDSPPAYSAGNPFRSDFKHFSDAGGTDLTSNGNDGALYYSDGFASWEPGSTGNTDGKYSLATTLDGTLEKHIFIDDDVSLQDMDDLYISIVFKLSASPWRKILFCLLHEMNNNEGFYINLKDSTTIHMTFNGFSGEWEFSPPGGISADTWYHLIVIYDRSVGSNIPVLIWNGSAVAEDSADNPMGFSYSGAGYISIGGERSLYYSTNGEITGLIGDVAVADNTAQDMDADWATTEYNNLFDLGNFITFENYESYVQSFSGMQSVIGQIGELIKHQSLLNHAGDTPKTDNHSLLSGLGNMDHAVLPSGLGNMDHLGLLAGLGNTDHLSLPSGLGNMDSFRHYTGLGLMSRQVLIGALSAVLSGHQALRITITAAELSGLQALRGILASTDYVQACQHILMSIGDPAAEIHTISRAVYLDGRPITGWCASVTISRDQNSIFNDVTIVSRDAELWHRADPDVNSGESRIEIQIDSNTENFLLERREGSPSGGFSLWGRDITARESDTYQSPTDYSLTAPTAASDIVADLAAVSAVDWDSDCEDFVCPDNYDFSGVPVDGIRLLAAEIGAIARAQSDGSLLIRNRYPVRPVDLDTTDADISYDQTELIALRREQVLGALFDAVIVSNNSDTVGATPRLEVEEDSLTMGDVAHVRVFWSGRENTTFSRYVTDGLVVSEGNHTTTISDEIVEFADSKATTAYPVTSINRETWYGDSASISYTPGSQKLTVGSDGDQLFRVCKMEYTTTYERLRITSANVPRLILALFLDILDVAGREVAVVASDGGDSPEYGDPIMTQYLTTPSGLRQRGTAWLDGNHYDYVDVTFDAPWDVTAVDGAICYINDAEIGDRGNYQIMAAGTKISGPRIINQIRARRWLI